MGFHFLCVMLFYFEFSFIFFFMVAFRCGFSPQAFHFVTYPFQGLNAGCGTISVPISLRFDGKLSIITAMQFKRAKRLFPQLK